MQAGEENSNTMIIVFKNQAMSKSHTGDWAVVLQKHVVLISYTDNWFTHNTSRKLLTTATVHCSALSLTVSGEGTGLPGFNHQVPVVKHPQIGCVFQDSTDNIVQEKEPGSKDLWSDIQAFEISGSYGTRKIKVALHKSSQG